MSAERFYILSSNCHPSIDHNLPNKTNLSFLEKDKNSRNNLATAVMRVGLDVGADIAKFKVMPDTPLTMAQKCLNRLLRVQSTVNDNDH